MDEQSRGARGAPQIDGGVRDMTQATIPESEETLLRQQRQLIAGRRKAQMFPLGTTPLTPPRGMKLCKTHKGIFHYNPILVDEDFIQEMVLLGWEHQLLNLGPFPKSYVMLLNGSEPEYCITERYFDGVELRCSVTCRETFRIQWSYFHLTKEVETYIAVERAATVLAARLGDPSAILVDNIFQFPGQSGCSPSQPGAPPLAGPEPSTSAE